MDRTTDQDAADWIAEMLSDDLDTFIPAEFCDLVIATEREIRETTGDAEMDHVAMAERLMAIFRENADLPTESGSISPLLVFEVLQWEDEFRAMAGAPRTVRPSPKKWSGQ